MVHDFAKEWIRLGHEVIVIYNVSVFPELYYLIVRGFRKFIESFFGTKVLVRRPKEITYEIDGVLVYRIPIFKWLPHGRFSNRKIENQCFKIKDFLSRKNFNPDSIVGHWINPQLEIIYNLKEIFKVKTSLILHDSGKDFETIYNHNFRMLLHSIDNLGFRSHSIMKKFELKFGKFQNHFLCPSGLPDIYFKNNPILKTNINSFLFVGNFFLRKQPSILPFILASALPNKSFKLTMVGEGYEERKTRIEIKKFQLENNVKIINRMGRHEILDEMSRHDVFIMISKDEAFGLVYLEAMAMGCITICSKDDAIDGIIVNGENGFLCDYLDVENIIEVIRNLKNMPASEINRISSNAIKTSRLFFESSIAKNYFNIIS